MAQIKTTEEIEILRRGGNILARALKITVGRAKAGVLMSELDKIAETAIRDLGATPSFL